MSLRFLLVLSTPIACLGLLTACGSDSDDAGAGAAGSTSSSTSSAQGGNAQGGNAQGGNAQGGDAQGGNGQGGNGQGGNAQGGAGQGGKTQGAGGGSSGSACGNMGLMCKPGQICVAFNATAGPTTTTTYECHEDPCSPQALACSCASKICQEKFNVDICSVDNDGVLNCDNGAVCASPDTPIATPSGDRPIAELRAGDLVYSMDRGALAIVPIARISNTAVSAHAVVAVQLSNGEVLHISGRHPTADGRLFADLKPGVALGALGVVGVATLPYAESHTYDILPASDSGTYFAGGALIGSTLSAP